LRKTRYKNKKNKTYRVKNNRTKKIYQRGGGPKAPKEPNPAKTPNPPKEKKRAKGASGDKFVEPKVSRSYRRRMQGHPDMPERHIAFKKANPTAEFDIPIDISGLPFHVSVKSVKRKTPGQKSFTIMCGDARRFLTELASGSVPYHMVIGIRQPHSTKPNKTEVVGCEIDLRDYKRILFGNSTTDEQIIFIIDESHRLTEAYYEDSESAKQYIDKFNAFLKGLNSKLRLAPKKENYDKKRDPRVQATFSFVPDAPENKQFVTPFDFSSMDNSPQDVDGDGAGEAATTTAMAMSTGQSAQSVAPVKTSRRRGVSKKPVEPRPPTEYFRSFKERLPKHESSLFTAQPQGQRIFDSAPFGQPGNVFSAIPDIGHAQGFVDPEDYGPSYLPAISEGRFPTSPAFTPDPE
jgi:hypothetical protein